MKSSDVALLIVPGWKGSDADHWQSRWESRLSTARRVEQDDFAQPDRGAWVEKLRAAVAAADKPVVLVAHSLGVPTVIHAAPSLPAGKVAGAFLVAPPDLDAAPLNPLFGSFAPIPRAPLPFPALVVASRNDPYCPYPHSQELAAAWGAELLDAGEAGHINPDAGFGPWPEGSMRLLGFLRALG
ncbi:RBBP9/YdeN family alpha/beta hydrolase [Xanthobacter variabilis]|uniref:RBBP9/YdeN family alpha/beta hydrolase n=1 Tax=Xanthobacter variabilis TaxID=3119932 RepID=UPI00372AA955